MMWLALISLIAYLMGSFPSAVWFGQIFHNLDVREHGSKNAGATNAFRILGKKTGVLVLAVDILKGLLSTLVPFLFLDGLHEIFIGQILASCFCIIGHIFPVFANFRGGKGVATTLGVLIGLSPWATLLILLIFLLVFLSFGYVSLGSICASIALPFISFFVFKESGPLFWVHISFGMAIILAHKKNIVRLYRGEETKMNLLRRKV